MTEDDVRNDSSRIGTLADDSDLLEKLDFDKKHRTPVYIIKNVNRGFFEYCFLLFVIIKK